MPAEHKKPLFVIGVTGPIGSGVSTVSHILKSMGFRYYRVSDAITASYTASGGGDLSIPGTDRRKLLQDHGNAQREKFGPSYWVEQALRVDAGDLPIVIDGIRNLGEIKWLRDHYPASYIAAIIALKETRWDRVKHLPSYQNNEAKFIRDDERDWDLEEGSTSGQQVQKCVLAADFVFVNNDPLGAVEAHRTKIRGHIEPSVKMMQGIVEARRPTPEEVHMATAYSQSHDSACLKRHVGAVIVDTDGFSISMGFNENPVGMLPCANEFEYCFKDNDMIAKMERMGKVYCSACGYAVEKLEKPWKCPECKNDMKKSLFTNRNM